MKLKPVIREDIRRIRPANDAVPRVKRRPPWTRQAAVLKYIGSTESSRYAVMAEVCIDIKRDSL